MSDAVQKSLGQKFQSWASSLPADEQAGLAQWWQKNHPPEVTGFSSSWWEGENAWQQAWWSAWEE